jgi:Flp pilus assembly pilin Flp
MFWVSLVGFGIVSLIVLAVLSVVSFKISSSFTKNENFAAILGALGGTALLPLIMIFGILKLALLWYVMTNVAVTGLTGTTLVAAVAHAVITLLEWVKTVLKMKA